MDRLYIDNATEVVILRVRMIDDTGLRIRHWRCQKGLTAKQLASRIGVHERTVYSWEQRRRSVPTRRLPAITAALEITRATFYGWLPSDEEE